MNVIDFEGKNRPSADGFLSSATSCPAVPGRSNLLWNSCMTGKMRVTDFLLMIVNDLKKNPFVLGSANPRV